MNVRAPCLWVLTIAVLACQAGLLRADIDTNGNGIDDAWEMIYGARDAAANDDDDKDLVSNGDEARAGTDPFNPDKFLTFESFEKSGDEVTITFASQPGKRYRIYQTPDTITPNWVQAGSDIIGDGTTMQVVLPGVNATEAYFRLGVDDIDTDNDGVNDWTERQLSGFDPNSDFSVNPSLSDEESFIFAFQNSAGPTVVTLAPMEVEAFEKRDAGGVRAGTVRIRRTGGNLAAMTAFFSVAGDASGADYTVEDESGQPVSGFIQIGQGQAERVVRIVPVEDSVAEYPETVDITLDEHPDYGRGAETAASIRIFDLEDTPQNWQLFYGQLTPERSAATTASGYATLRLNGKRTVALVDLNFSGLSSTQNAAHVHQSNNNGSGGVTNGPTIESLPLGVVDDHVWNIGPAGANSAQDTIDALFGQNGRFPLYANAHTTNNSGGEVWAFFAPYEGGDFTPPDDPPPLTDLNADLLRRDVVRFLTQATFGPTEDEVDALYDSIVNEHAGDRIAAYSAWIDDQYLEADTKFFDMNYALDQEEWSRNGNSPLNQTNPQPFNNHHRIAWFTIARAGQDQLRKRVAFALGQIAVISEENGTVRARSYGACSYFDMLSENADDSYREVLVDVSKHPLMGKYLSHLQNSKATVDGSGNVLISPDENYAREIMQLFSIGLVMLNPDGSLLLNENGEPVSTYSNADITELARVFTGWSFSLRIGSRSQGYPTSANTTYGYTGGPRYFEDPWIAPMRQFDSQHDFGSKTVLGVNIPGGNGEQDLQAAVDILFNHQNIAPFISRRLIQRLVTSNPSNAYIYRVSQAWANSNGNIKETVRAILLDYEAREMSLVDDIGYGKQKEPVIRQIQVMRALNSQSEAPIADLTTFGLSAAQIAAYEAGSTQHRFVDMTSRIGQSPHWAPSVFNWFLPDFILGGDLAQNGLVAPEFTITSETQVVGTVNHFWDTFYSNTGMFGRVRYGNAGSDTDHRMLLDFAGIMQELTDELAVAPGANTSQRERNAITVVFDRYDFLLCAGAMKARYAAATGDNPRTAIIDACELVWSSADDATTNTDLREVARNIIYLLCSSPDYLTQR